MYNLFVDKVLVPYNNGCGLSAVLTEPLGVRPTDLPSIIGRGYEALTDSRLIEEIEGGR